MERKRFINIAAAFGITVFLLLMLFAARCIIRINAVKKAVSVISVKVFNGSTGVVDYRKSTVIFRAEESELFRKLELSGDILFKFSSSFFELPWHINVQEITLTNAAWDLNLQQKKLNGQDWNKLSDRIFAGLSFFEYGEKKFPDFITRGNLLLTNQSGEKRRLEMKSIFKKNKKFRLLGVHAGDMKINFFYNEDSGKLIGQYQAARSDFEFFRLSFGLPELFNITGVNILAGQFQYDVAGKKIDYIRGGCNFGLQSVIQGSIFTIYGSRSGRINWEYLNQQNWQIELRNVVSGKPFQTRLHYLVLSQNTMEKDALNFDGEIEFTRNSFRNIFELELDKRTSNIRHRIVGKWDMVQKSWELSRLDTQRRVPQVKVKWRDADIAFRGRTFKLSGSGAQSDHFGFHYELDMENMEWKDKSGNALVGADVKFEGDCILSLSDDSLKPVASGRISCEVADGAFGNSRFILKNAFLNFAPDSSGKNKYHFSFGSLKTGFPDLRKGLVLEIPQLSGVISREKTEMEAPFFTLYFRDMIKLASSGKLTAARRGSAGDIVIESTPLKGQCKGEFFSLDKIYALCRRYDSSGSQSVKIDWALKNIKWLNRFEADSVNGTVEYLFQFPADFRLKNFTVVPEHWKIDSGYLRWTADKSEFYISGNDNLSGVHWYFKSLPSQIENNGKKYDLSFDINGKIRKNYDDGVISGESSGSRFNIAFTRNHGKDSVSFKDGNIENPDAFLRGITGTVKLDKKSSACLAELQFSSLKYGGAIWENGELALNGNLKRGLELTGFSAASGTELAKIVYTGKNSNGENEFEVKNFSAKYVENIIGVKEGTFSGLFEGRVTVKKGEFFNPFKIQTFYLKNNLVARMCLGSLEKFARRGNTVEDDFARDALKDFFAKTLILDYHGVGDYMILNVNALGKSTDLLPYEYDIKEKKLKKSDVALFNAEVEVSAKYMIKKP